ncbi:MAG: hypothetical protein ABMB14_15440 [Myxococcota bacterium]
MRAVIGGWLRPAIAAVAIIVGGAVIAPWLARVATAPEIAQLDRAR